MKKLILTAFLTVSVISFCNPATAFAKSIDKNEVNVLDERNIELSTSNGMTTTRSTDLNSNSKTFTLKTLDDNGTMVYDFGNVDLEYREAAMVYLNKLTGDVQIQDSSCSGPYYVGTTYYLNDQGYDNNTNATTYAWIDYLQTASWTGSWNGGMSSGYFGSGNLNYIVLNQEASFNGIGVTISWPPALSGTSTSRSWQSQPMYNTTVAGATIAKITASRCTSAHLSNTGDIYVGSSVYRPTTYISYTSF